MADFGCTSSVINNKIFQQYCMVFYCYQNCALYNKDYMSQVEKHLWRLPYHS